MNANTFKNDPEPRPEEAPLESPSWVIRFVFVVLGLALWFYTQSLIGAQPVVHGEVHDALHVLLTPANLWLHEHPGWSNALLISSSAVIDLLGIFLLLSAIFGPTVRPFLGLLMIFGLRQLCQLSTGLPTPDGMIWNYPGFPSLLVTYGVANDLFFSGHTAIAVYGVTELVRLRRRGLTILGIFLATFEAATVLVLRAHYTMDVFTGIIVALFVADIAARVAPACDRALVRIFGRRLHVASERAILLGLRYVVWFGSRLLLALRYRVRVKGLENLGSIEGGALILPNHPGYIDPTILLIALFTRLQPRPMLYENNFLNPVLYPFMKLLNALRVPDLETASVQAKARARQAIDDAITALRAGENVLLYPAGRIQRGGGMERLGGTRAVADILQARPETPVILVRTRGVWGSKWSYAWTGQQPKIFRLMLQGAGWLLANLLLFTPRRRVELTVEPVARDKMPEPRREVLNPWLEAWYNLDGPEVPTFVPYHWFLGPRGHEYPTAAGLEGADLSKVKADTKAAIAELLADKLSRPLTETEQQPETTLDQLGLDSLDRMELALTVEQRFGFSCDEAPVTIGEFWALAQGLIERGPPKPAPPAWFQPANECGALEVLGNTIGEAFVARALRNRRDVAVADDLAGVLTYERLLVGALTLARRFKRLPAPNVGLLLPASVACDTALMGLYLAGKLPVVLNWTTGPGNLAHAARTMSLTHVVTSRAFIDRTGIAVEGAQYLFLEDLRQGMGKWELLRTLLRVRLFPGRIARRIPPVAPDQPAVVLFTSGSERAPKAVPLTHANMISDQRAGIAALGLTRQDSMLGFLPAFHSFGFSATVLLPILAGMRLIHHPDPTDAAGLARKCASYKPTILLGTPTFVSYILARVKPGDLDALRLAVVGAEKCPPALFEEFARVAPAATLLEGYGITECAPVVAVNGPKANRPGSLGKPLPGVEVRVVDLDTDALLPPGQQGMLLVSGPTVFPGYIAFDGPSPFRELDGKRWYVTGDLVRIDADGYIWFAGRLKRFLKAGGEMISLPALEEPFARLYPPTESGPRVAVEGIETPEGRRIVLFTTESLALREANARLQEEGFRGVMRLDEVRRLEAVPVLGTGKTDYKALRALITAGETPSVSRGTSPVATGPRSPT